MTELIARHSKGARAAEAVGLWGLISTDPATGAGVAFVRLEGDPDPVRVRAGWVSDTDIGAMACQVAEDTRPQILEGVPVWPT